MKDQTLKRQSTKALCLFATLTAGASSFGFVSCKTRAFSPGLSSVRSEDGDSQARYSATLELRDTRRLPNTTSSKVGERIKQGAVIAEVVPHSGFEIVSQGDRPPDSQEQGTLFEARLANGQAATARRIEETVTIAMKDGGWWVTPIHAILLPWSGQVLMAGWRRRDRDRQDSDGQRGNVCDAGGRSIRLGSRRYGVSWLWDPQTVTQNPLQVERIDTLREKSWLSENRQRSIDRATTTILTA